LAQWSFGLEAISKRLDRFLLTEDLALQDGRIRTWVDNPYFSDHARSFYNWILNRFLKAFPFKFNSSWLLESDFNTIVLDVWKDPNFLTELDLQKRLGLET
jgi:hypothetical protein